MAIWCSGKDVPHSAKLLHQARLVLGWVTPLTVRQYLISLRRPRWFDVRTVVMKFIRHRSSTRKVYNVSIGAYCVGAMGAIAPADKEVWLPQTCALNCTKTRMKLYKKCLKCQNFACGWSRLMKELTCSRGPSSRLERRNLNNAHIYCPTQHSTQQF